MYIMMDLNMFVISIIMYWKMKIYFKTIEMILNLYEICNIYFTCDFAYGWQHG
jgi:hypothetical protein